MHELSIAIALVEQIVEVAEENQMPRVDVVEIETGVLRQVIPEMMQAAFKEAASNSAAGGGILMITETPAKAQCNQCNLEFEPEIDNYLCPKCQIADVKILTGHEIILKAVSCDVEKMERGKNEG